MKVKELIERLKELDPELEVKYQKDDSKNCLYGSDYWPVYGVYSVEKHTEKYSSGIEGEEVIYLSSRG